MLLVTFVREADKTIAARHSIFIYIYRKIRKCTHGQIILDRGSENGKKRWIVEDVLARFLIFHAVHKNEMRERLSFFVDMITATTLFVQPVMLCMFRGLDEAFDAVCLETAQRTRHGGHGRGYCVSSMLGVSGSRGFGGRCAGVSETWKVDSEQAAV